MDIIRVYFNVKLHFDVFTGADNQLIINTRANQLYKLNTMCFEFDACNKLFNRVSLMVNNIK